jgi:uncharacterized protein (UPF0332 family)
VDSRLLKSCLNIHTKHSFFYAVISHAYYSIFYSAKAYLELKGVRTEAPDEHHKTLMAFKSFVDDGVLDMELLRIYNEEYARAATLLRIFRSEKKKRGDFTYQMRPEANRQPAESSLEQARTFYSQLFALCSLSP